MNKAVMPFGRYKGVYINKIPNSYLRWLVTVPNIPPFVREEARRKLESSDYDDSDIEVTRHALDMFSKRFLDKWIDHETGLGTFVARMSLEALNKGKLIADERIYERGVKMYFDDIIWVFTWHKDFPQFKALITVMKPSIKTKRRLLQNQD